MYTYIHTYIHIYIHTYVRACECVCVFVYNISQFILAVLKALLFRLYPSAYV